jgi:hypothetical protein
MRVSAASISMHHLVETIAVLVGLDKRITSIETMKTISLALRQLLIAILLSFAVTTSYAFVPTNNVPSLTKTPQRQNAPQPSSLVPCTTRSGSRPTSRTQLYMGGKMSKFGIFSPAVYAAKFALGPDRLNKIRGKAISLHSQYIGDFCEWIGAYHLRTQLIKKAKVNGDTLGFLV